MQLKRYKASEFNLSHDMIDPDAYAVVCRLQKKGFDAYLVGGSVRDLLLGHPPKDVDISTNARPEEIKTHFRNCLLIGRRFRLAHIRFKNKIIEVATFRSGDNSSEELIVRDNTWGTEQEDAMRRDFTLNGLYYDPCKEEILDYVDGVNAVSQNQIETIGDPYLRFKQDPVRMLRLVKFRARFGFNIEEKTRQALIDCRHEILKSSPARILEELLRMLESGHSRQFIHMMTDFGLLKHILPKLARTLETDLADKTYSFLDEIDRLQKEENRTLHRSILLASLVMPQLDHHLSLLYGSKEGKVTLETIHKETRLVTDEIFFPFLQLPRRLCSEMQSILTSQYRFTPINRPTSQVLRIPRNPEFKHALTLLDVRSGVSYELRDTFNAWSEIYQHHKAKNYVPTPRSRYYKKRRKRK
ncbi:MAG: Poly(A) polymerase I [Chlamydiia bacterium]|nr:Poly(A) polymerase I [Chlamydiia bacterium]